MVVVLLGFQSHGLGGLVVCRSGSGCFRLRQWLGNARDGFGRQTWPDGAPWNWSKSSQNQKDLNESHRRLVISYEFIEVFFDSSCLFWHRR